MTKGFPRLEANSAIFFMILTAVFISNSSESSFHSIKSETEDIEFDDEILASSEAAAEKNDMGLILRLLGMKSSQEEDDQQLLTHRHWYFKPRRKFNAIYSSYHKMNKLDIDANIVTDTRYSRHRASRTLRKSSKSDFQNEDIISQRPSRGKRSYSYDHVFGPTSFPGDSKNIDDLRRSRTNMSKIYHKATSSLLQIKPDGKILGVPEFDIYCVLMVKGVDHVENMTMVKIYGNATKLYLAMRGNGILYTTSDPSNAETKFLHDYEPTSHDAFLSYMHRRYIEMVGHSNSGHSSPTRAKGLRKFDGPSKRARFLEIELDHATLRTLASSAAQVDQANSEDDRKGQTTSERISETSNKQLETESEIATTTRENLPTSPATAKTRASTVSTATTNKRRSRHKKKGRRRKGRRRKGKRRKKEKGKRRKRKDSKQKSRKRTKTRTARSIPQEDEKFSNIPYFESTMFRKINTRALSSILQDDEVT